MRGRCPQTAGSRCTAPLHRAAGPALGLAHADVVGAPAWHAGPGTLLLPASGLRLSRGFPGKCAALTCTSAPGRM